MNLLKLSESFINSDILRQKLSQTLDRVEDGQTIIVIRKGLPAVVLVDAELFDQMQAAMSLQAQYHTALADAAQARENQGEALTKEQYHAALSQLGDGTMVNLNEVNFADYVEVDEN